MTCTRLATAPPRSLLLFFFPTGAACTLSAAPLLPLIFGVERDAYHTQLQGGRARLGICPRAAMRSRLKPFRHRPRFRNPLRRLILLASALTLVCLLVGLFVLPRALKSDAARPAVSRAPEPLSSRSPRWIEQGMPVGSNSLHAVFVSSPSALTASAAGAPSLNSALDEGGTTARTAGEASTGITYTNSGAAQHTDGRQRGEGELHVRYAAELAQLDALDVFPLRPLERRISFIEFARCLGALLSVSPDTGAEAARDDIASERYAPCLISVTLENTQDLKALICNLTVPYRHIVLAQNGDTPEVTPFFGLLRRVFAFTTRLTVLQFLDNIGFAGAVNAGLREALGHPFSEVPFVHILHNDVRFLSSSLEQTLARAYKRTAKDMEVIETLAKEVVAEPNEYTPLLQQPYGLRAPLVPGTPLPQERGRKPVVVTSALLPDRIRYMVPTKRVELMRGHTSFIFANSHGEYTTVFLSRLAVLTVGFFDENFFPILYDDTDYRWRAHLLGFAEDRDPAMNDQVISFDLDCTNQRGTAGDNNDDAERRSGLRQAAARPALSPEGQALQRDCRKAFYAGVQYAYMQQKWGVESMKELMEPHTRREPFSDDAFGGKRRLPLDAWVVDTGRLAELRKWLRDVGRHTLDVQNYDVNIILRAVGS
ncbi:hypothetical protein LSCM1_04060 [Leishmania martiniquensis]|uniref:Galactofuranosyltransferase lpg1-like protein n=1 Tax=Leishmania martiniquensis TaxID=1580590 RepID=A0A836H7C7_9TRYP|nr:hypothetical protein LSCM1_04060 [Leishmania martiniquensis]